MYIAIMRVLLVLDATPIVRVSSPSVGDDDDFGPIADLVIATRVNLPVRANIASCLVNVYTPNTCQGLCTRVKKWTSAEEIHIRVWVVLALRMSAITTAFRCCCSLAKLRDTTPGHNSIFKPTIVFLFY
jgi:hypothetical protein